MQTSLVTRNFYLLLTSLCLIYLLAELFFNHFTTLCVDDFWFAHWIYQYKHGIPYRDFSPYKTVLGYYLLLPFMLVSKGLLTPLYITKDGIALINAACFFISAIWLKRYFPKLAVFLSLLLLMYSEFVLRTSTNIRVDLLAYWFCLFSFLRLMDKRFILGGILIGLGFVTSQKVLWYIVASNAALGVYWLYQERHWKYFYKILQFNIISFLVVLGYIVFWASFSNLTTVLHNMFYDAFVMYKLDVYDSTRPIFWSWILIHNPLPFMLWPITFLSLIFVLEKDELYPIRLSITVYATVIMLCLIVYKQIFPYYMLTALPALLLLYAAFMTWLYQLIFLKQPIKFMLVGKKLAWILLLAYVLLLFFLFKTLQFPSIYLIINFVLFMMLVYITSVFKTENKRIFTQYLISSVCIYVAIYSFSIFAGEIYTREFVEKSHQYQKAMLGMADKLLNKEGDYLAGIELFYDRNQPIQSLKHLDVPGLSYLYSPNDKLRDAMLPSLYHSPDASIPDAINALAHSQVKLYINNYRMHAIPPAIQNYLNTQYTHFWGSIYLYSPIVEKGDHRFQIKFTGNYRLDSHSNVRIDNKLIEPNKIIELTSGEHDSYSKDSYRLQLLPDNMGISLNKAFQNDDWIKMM